MIILESLGLMPADLGISTWIFTPSLITVSIAETHAFLTISVSTSDIKFYNHRFQASSTLPLTSCSYLASRMKGLFALISGPFNSKMIGAQASANDKNANTELAH
jgi:hypothetical protein